MPDANTSKVARTSQRVHLLGDGDPDRLSGVMFDSQVIMSRPPSSVTSTISNSSPMPAIERTACLICSRKHCDSAQIDEIVGASGADQRRQFGYRRLFIQLRGQGQPRGVNRIYRSLSRVGAGRAQTEKSPQGQAVVSKGDMSRIIRRFRPPVTVASMTVTSAIFRLGLLDWPSDLNSTRKALFDEPTKPR